MKFLSADVVARHLPWTTLIDKLDDTFRTGVNAPARHHHTIERPDGEATMLLMPAWEQHGYIGMKMLNVFPQNSSVGLPAISGLYLLSEGQYGQTLACIAGNELTRRRTAAASALAARYLAKTSAQTLLIVGTGQVAPMLIEAHAAVRPIQRVLVWGRNPDKVQAMVDEYQDYQGAFTTITQIEAVSDLAKTCAQADIISCATLSKEPIVRGEWLQPGCHLDLVGAFRKDMRECDGEAVARSQVFVDTWAGAKGEAGDLHQAMAEGLFSMEDIHGDLEQLTRHEVFGRRSDDDITLFKSVGASLEDLAAAIVLWEGLPQD
ncbi:ornithine cyclodeaminase family protein [Vibrio fluvialis]|uniref:ornithine cyclodeaminase family protein n=1 Tax=Vibrio fluvialis TaxID=676 RepID=UPI001EEB0629|nr:ornithine cyclodeaminase family protein [Vibrio fluvialis]MCG6401207.1 ornithine cyclodeaminase family protein [Vibrio fluvialis]